MWQHLMDWLRSPVRPWRRSLTWAGVGACLALTLWTVDAFGTRAEARRREWTARLADLREHASDPEQTWRGFVQLCIHYPEMSTTEDMEQLQTVFRTRREEHITQRAKAAHEELVQAEARGTTLSSLQDQAERFLRDFQGSAPEEDVRRRQAAYALRLEERDIEPARELSARQPLEFAKRRALYLSHLERYPTGAFAKEATSALRTIGADWDQHDFRAVRDHYEHRTGDVAELVTRCRSYLAAHPEGRFRGAASDLLRWTERVTMPGEYRVTLRGGQFEKGLARFLSRGPDLSVELEVNGVRHGPSPVSKNSYEPEWNYEFPRRVRWKLGDPVVIRVMDHDWRDRVVLELCSPAGDLFALRLLSGAVRVGGNAVTFESDFILPGVPMVESNADRH